MKNLDAQELEEQLLAPDGMGSATEPTLPTRSKGPIPIQVPDLSEVPDEIIAGIDAVVESRLLYGISLLTLRNFLRQKAPTWDEATRQAALALNYVRHCEARGLKHLQLGRNLRDDQLTTQLEELRSQISQLADQRATLIARGRERDGNGETQEAETET